MTAPLDPVGITRLRELEAEWRNLIAEYDRRTSPHAAFASAALSRCVDQLAAVLADHPAPVSGWQPMETAPKNGNVLLWAGKTCVMGVWDWNEPRAKRTGTWRDYSDWDVLYPTHWTPLPEPPA